MTAPAVKESTAVQKVNGRNMLDITSAKANQKFLDAYTNGNLNKLTQDEQTMFLFALGARLGVRPELGELMIYQGKPYITIDGRFRLAHESGLLVGVEPRPATPMERRNYGCVEGDVLWVCDVYRRGSTRGFRGWGHVGKNDRNPVSKQFPREMAKKRAKYDGLRMAFPPAEQISLMHERYIEEAEAAIRSGQRGTVPMVFADPEDGDERILPAGTEAGEAAAADAGAVETEPAKTEAPATEKPKAETKPASAKAAAAVLECPGCGRKCEKGSDHHPECRRFADDG